jgi:hypothetical protein
VNRRSNLQYVRDMLTRKAFDAEGCALSTLTFGGQENQRRRTQPGKVMVEISWRGLLEKGLLK